MKPSKIILIRHGESEGNVDKSTYVKKPDYSIELTRKGVEQSLERGTKLNECFYKFYSVYVSPYFRTRRTWENIKKSLVDKKCLRTEESPLIREQEWNTGIEAHEKNHELERSKTGAFYYRFPNGESCADCFFRAKLFLDEMFKNNEIDKSETIIIVSHGMMIRVLAMALMKLKVEEFEMLRNPQNCEALELSLSFSGEYKSLQTMRVRNKLPHNFVYVDEQ